MARAQQVLAYPKCPPHTQPTLSPWPHTAARCTTMTGDKRVIHQSVLRRMTDRHASHEKHTISAIQRATRMIQRPQNLSLGKQSHTEAEKITRTHTEGEVCNFFLVGFPQNFGIKRWIPTEMTRFSSPNSAKWDHTCTPESWK